MRRPARTGLVQLCDRDLGDFGFTVLRAPALVGTMTLSHPGASLAGLAGQIPTARDATIDPTTITIEVAYLGDTQAELMTALDALAHWCSLGPLELATAYDPTKLALVTYQGAGLFIPGKQFKEPTWQGTLTFLRRVPYAFDRAPRRVVSNGAGAANRVPVETGTAPSHAVLWLLDATAASITQRAANGAIVRQSALTTVLAGNDTLLIDGARSRLTHYANGLPADVPEDLVLGHGFVTLEPRYAHFEAQQWQTLETNSGRLLVDYVRGWLR